jgi:PIN domain nuclease of toxin-antitoxin system
MNRVFDASALVTFLRGETGCEVVAEILGDPDSICFTHYFNLVEVYARIARTDGEASAEAAIQELIDLGISIVPDIDETISKQAANWTCLFQMSLADGFGLALSQRLSADFVSCDTHELEVISQSGLQQITFVRPPNLAKSYEDRELARAVGAISRLRQMEKTGATGTDWRAAIAPLLNH